MEEPNFFIVGAAKAGTTSLYTYLNKIPSVAMSSMKEPHYFSASALKTNGSHAKVSDWNEYLALFSEADNGDAVGEASPSYLWDKEAAQSIKERLPNAKIIVVIRDPIERAFSHYLADVRLGWQTRPFYEALLADIEDPRKEWGQAHLYLELGCYTDQIGRYYQYFSHERVKVILFDKLKQDPLDCIRDICSFLDVNVTDYVPDEFKAENVAAVPRGRLAKWLLGDSPVKRAAKRMLPARAGAFVRDRVLLTREKPFIELKSHKLLEKYYKEEMHKLQILLKYELPWIWVNK